MQDAISKPDLRPCAQLQPNPFGSYGGDSFWTDKTANLTSPITMGETTKGAVVFRVTTLQTMWNSPTVLGTLSVTHIRPVLALNTCMDANMQFTINSFRKLFPDKVFSLTFHWFLVKSLTLPWQRQIPWHFQVFQTNGHPVFVYHI